MEFGRFFGQQSEDVDHNHNNFIVN